MDLLTAILAGTVAKGALWTAGVISILFLGWIGWQLLVRTREAAEMTESSPTMTGDPPTITGQPREATRRESTGRRVTDATRGTSSPPAR